MERPKDLAALQQLLNEYDAKGDGVYKLSNPNPNPNPNPDRNPNPRPNPNQACTRCRSASGRPS